MKTKIDQHGYVRITSDPTRSAWEHIRVAEDMLGRKLGKTEQVHHINGDKTDNRPDNLMVFRTNGDHIRYHAHSKESELIQTCDGSYVTITKQRKCPNCLRLFVPNNGRQKYCSVSCYQKSQSENVPSKEQLLSDLNTASSMCSIGHKYGVCDNTVRKWCVKYGLPTSVAKNITD